MSEIRSAELLAVGTELLLGETIDTNTSYLAGSLARRGVDVYWSQRVGDNLERVAHAISQALARSDLLVITGGLGPTEDDLTREAIAVVLNEQARVDPELESALRERFARGGREMPEANLKQAWLIPSATSLPNPLGTAPGWLVRSEQNQPPRFVVALPGPPRELERMWQQEALPRLALAPSYLHTTTIKTHGLGESAIAERLADLTPAANPSVATYAKNDGVHVRVAAKGRDDAQARQLAAATERIVLERLAEAVWGLDDEELPQLLIDALQRRGLTLAVFESASGGMLVDALSRVTGGNDACLGGVVAWAPQTMEVLGLPRPSATGAKGLDRAEDLAEAIRQSLSADVGVATLEQAAPVAGRQGQAADEAVVAVRIGDESVVEHLNLPPLPAVWKRERVTNLALRLLWSRLH